MDTLPIRIKRNLRYLRHIGVRQYLRYLAARGPDTIPIWIGEAQIWVRPGTHDLSVAITSLTGEFDLLRDVQPSDFDGVIVDAGGYIGTAAIAMAHLFPKARILTIEPVRDNMLVLRQNVARYANIQPIHGALVGQPGPDLQMIDRGTGTWGFSVAQGSASGVLKNTAPALELTGLGVDLSDIGILKLDIEGSEFDLLTHAAPALAQINAILIELHDRIIAGCSDAFFAFSADRTVIRNGGEKYLSLRA